MIILLAGFSLIRPRLLNGHWHFLDWLERNSKSQWLVVIVCGRCFSSSTVRAALLRVWESDQKPPGGSLNMFEMLAKEILSFFLSLCSSICLAFHPCGPSGGQLDKHSRFWHCCSFVLGLFFWRVCVRVVDFGVSVFMLVIITLEGEGFSMGLRLCHCFDCGYKYEKLFKWFLQRSWSVPVSKWLLPWTFLASLACTLPLTFNCLVNFLRSAAGIRPDNSVWPLSRGRFVPLWNNNDDQLLFVYSQQTVKSV